MEVATTKQSLQSALDDLLSLYADEDKESVIAALRKTADTLAAERALRSGPPPNTDNLRL